MLGAMLSKFDNAVLSAVIAIDADTENIHFYTMKDGDTSTINHQTESCRASLFSEEFYEKFGIALKNYREKNPDVSLQKAALVLPNRVFMLDTINVPTMKKQMMANSLVVSINSLYKNNSDLKFNDHLLGQNKQYATFGIVGIRKELLVKLNKTCSENGVSIAEITYAGNTLANAGMHLNSSLKNESFVMLDLKENKTNMAYVLKGKTVGYYQLPFGYNILHKSRLTSEDLIFDHATGELLVLNAKEKAKARQLTTIDQTSTMGTAGTEFDGTEDVDDDNDGVAEVQPDVSFEGRNSALLKKTARKLPKFMLREQPKNKEEYLYENFRIFMKWAQDLIVNNPVLTSLGETNKIYVNMPKDFDFLFEVANKDCADVKITYATLIPEAAYNEEVAKKLELYGGFFVKQHNRVNNF